MSFEFFLIVLSVRAFPSRSGITVEVQFHTAKSFATKMQSHDMYDTFKQRGCELSGESALCRTLNESMLRMEASVPVPPSSGA